jgi:hypothetical protein
MILHVKTSLVRARGLRRKGSLALTYTAKNRAGQQGPGRVNFHILWWASKHENCIILAIIDGRVKFSFIAGYIW